MPIYFGGGEFYAFLGRWEILNERDHLRTLDEKGTEV
jgi:hypothetical protein